jgi:hypothetical protein
MTIVEDLDLDRALLNDDDLRCLQGLELTECYEANPDNPFRASHPLTALREVHRQEWDARIHGARPSRRVTSQSPEEAESAEDTQQDAPAPQTGTQRLCVTCGDVIPPTGKPGKPAKRCLPCRETS